MGTDRVDAGRSYWTINSFPRLVDASGKDKEVEASVEALRKQLSEVQDRRGAGARAAVVPVKHTVTVAVAQ